MSIGKSVRLTLSFKRESDGLPVYFKSDGQRFANPQTIKFQQDETYNVEITVRPVIPIEQFQLQDEKISLEKINKSLDPNALTYAGIWKTTGFPVTDKNKREQLKLTISLWNKGTLTASLQSKFYEHTETQHARWGDKLTFVEFECTVSADGSLTVLKQIIQ
ncbi:putative CB1 cannabinoid receptor-interacting protein 1 [Hypsibius exemplaris]|uniref:CB1 cannabinoid receptor-interacting protein 1 n=1 Tax=Hypsibius exemplaris TaxID=2072580 RepID=A0A9X6NIM9_HYPEX|nr:putative CB1 cannabinoid receptor-interacting protein 1 [Hypsibius exemplaris]